MNTMNARQPRLMIGFSAQDIDVQDIFLEDAQGSGWNWTDDPKPFLFAEEDLKPGQCDVLASMYAGAYAANRPAIEAAARVRVYAKSLLIALLRLIDPVPWWRAIPIAIASPLICWYVLQKLLLISLPSGMLGLG